MNNLIILGAGGHGEVCAEIAELSGKYNKIFFLDDDTSKKQCLKYNVIGTFEDYIKYKNDDFFVAIGDNKLRKKYIERLNKPLDILIHPNAIISQSCTIQEGTVIMPGVVINANTHIGKGCIINTSVSVDHDCSIGDYVHLSPGVHLGGTCEIGDFTWVGIGSIIVNNITVNENEMIKAGTVIKRSLKKDRRLL